MRNFLFLLFFQWQCWAGEPVRFVSESEFAQLIADLAPKVNLFKEVWKIDPQAKFFGGTSRDFIYWIKRNLQDSKSREQTQIKLAQLRALPTIDIRDFLVKESDVDVVSALKGHTIDPSYFGIKKIDFIRSDRLYPRTEVGQNELLQGYIPIEKILIGKSGVVDSAVFGNGLSEVWSGKITAHFASDSEFNASYYAKIGINHPILLAIRYLRTLSIDYYSTYGRRYPNTFSLFQMDRVTEQRVRTIVQKTLMDPAFPERIQNEKFLSFLNQSIRKCFSAYVNPTASFLLFQKFEIPKLIQRYDSIQKINTYLFSKNFEPSVISSHIRQYLPSENGIFTEIASVFPDGKLYHGASTEEAFRGILLQGAIPSESKKLAGTGLYGVSNHNLQYAIQWNGGGRSKVVSFELDPRARLIDVTQGPGETLWRLFIRKHPHGSYDDFADYFGADILRYPYETVAFVVKNSAVLQNPRGLDRDIVTFSSLVKLAEDARTLDDGVRVISSMILAQTAESDALYILNRLQALPNVLAAANTAMDKMKGRVLPMLMRTYVVRFVVSFTLLREYIRLSGKAGDPGLSAVLDLNYQAAQQIFSLLPNSQEIAQFSKIVVGVLGPFESEKERDLFSEVLKNAANDLDSYFKFNLDKNKILNAWNQNEGYIKAKTLLPLFGMLINALTGLGELGKPDSMHLWAYSEVFLAGFVTYSWLKFLYALNTQGMDSKASDKKSTGLQMLQELLDQFAAHTKNCGSLLKP